MNVVTSSYIDGATNAIILNNKNVNPSNFPSKKYMVIGTYAGASDSNDGASIYIFAVGADSNVRLYKLCSCGDDYPMYKLTSSNNLYVQRSTGDGTLTVYTKLIALN